jgi:hypothetical protein
MQILTTDEIAPFIETTLLEIRKGLCAARKHGIEAEMPEAIQISALIVSKPQHIPVTALSEKQGKSHQTGETNDYGTKDEATITEGKTTGTGINTRLTAETTTDTTTQNQKQNSAAQTKTNSVEKSKTIETTRYEKY